MDPNMQNNTRVIGGDNTQPGGGEGGGDWDWMNDIHHVFPAFFKRNQVMQN